MKENFKKKSSLLMVICFLIPDIRLGILLTRNSIFNIANQKVFTASDNRDLLLLVVLPMISIIEATIFTALYFSIKSENIWKKIFVFMEVLLVLSILGFLVSI